jgi:hypothetical protein
MKPKMKSKARMKMLKKLKSKARDEMHEEPMKELTKGMQKITIASDSKEGLEEGLDKAKEILKGRMKMMDDDDEHECGSSEDYACGGTKHEDGGTKRELLKKLKSRK